jgi:hypothetical protein
MGAKHCPLYSLSPLLSVPFTLLNSHIPFPNQYVSCPPALIHAGGQTGPSCDWRSDQVKLTRRFGPELAARRRDEHSCRARRRLQSSELL